MPIPFASGRIRHTCRAFTLVELLVVIGIIALLVGVLLPTLASARRAAATVRCGAQLQEVGLAFSMYGNEFHDFYPVGKYTGSYSLASTIYPTSTGAFPFWMDFLASYVSKVKVGGAVVTADEQANAMKTIFWGCPAWERYTTGSPDSLTGYGMNIYPTFIATNSLIGMPPLKEWALIPGGRFQKRNRWTQPSERALVGDGRLWQLYSNPAPTGSLPPQPVLTTSFNDTPGVTGQTWVDVYRHGKYPGLASIPGALSTTGGSVGFNILYADGHVAKVTTMDVAYRVIRMRFPG